MPKADVITMKKVIIGAGPAGLYTAIRLLKSGIPVKDIVIYDPRAGVYTRPGHLDPIAFKVAEMGTGVKLLPSTKSPHIKDLERSLYAEAVRLGITIEKKEFVELHSDPKDPGVVIFDKATGTQEITVTNYVFDCTGTKREVIHAVNRVEPTSPLQLTTIANPPVKTHFIAYVKMKDADFTRFNTEKQRIEIFPDSLDSLNFSRSIIKLRALGWKELKLPRCYGMPFSKEKVGLYIHAPDNLPKEHYDLWVQTVLECYNTPIRYEHLPPSRKYPSKPRFGTFQLNAETLIKVAYKGDGLPTVIALGDAQIDFDYSLGHGIVDGLQRIDGLFEHMEFYKGDIAYFYADEYQNTIDDQLKKHKMEVKDAADQLSQSFVDALQAAKLKLRGALSVMSQDTERETVRGLLGEIEVREGYVKALQNFDKVHNEARQLTETAKSSPSLSDTLRNIHNDLVNALSGLPENFIQEKKNAQILLESLATSWKEQGSYLFKNNRIPEAIEAYNKALEIYNLPPFRGKYPLTEAMIYSNLSIAYNKGKQYSEAISAANTALSIFSGIEGDKPSTLYEKIVYNLISTLCIQAQGLLTSKKSKDATSLHLQAQQLMNTHEAALTHTNLARIVTTIDDLQKKLSESVAKRNSEGNLVSEDVMGAQASSSRPAQLLQKMWTFAQPQTDDKQPPPAKKYSFKCSIL